MTDIQERDRILNSAEDKFMSQGFVKVTVDEIAEDLGMSKKTIYKFFPSKEEIMLGIMRMNMRRLEKQVASIVESAKPFDQKFSEFLALLARLTSKFSKQLQKDVRTRMPELDREIETFRREKIYGRLHTMFLQAKDEGFIRKEVNVEIIMLVFMNAAQNIMVPSILAQHEFSAEEAFRQIFRILFEGALTDSARESFHFFDAPSNMRERTE